MKNTIAYYRASLADAQILAPALENAVEVPRESIVGTVSDATQIIRGFHAKTAQSKTAQDKPPTVWPVTVVYLRGSVPVAHGYTREHRVLPMLCVRATLQVNGTLTPDLDAAPWIPRDLLGPSNTAAVDLIGDLGDADEYYTMRPFEAPTIASMADAIGYACGLFSAVTSVDPTSDSREVGSFALAEGALLVDASEQVNGTSAQLISLMDYAARSAEAFPLADTLTRVRTTAPAPLPGASFWHAAVGHGGTMSNRHPLSTTQREAMHHFIASADGEVVAVNGPPGTGKTTLLQSIVAQLMVERAAGPGHRDAPLIVATSANNQAVTNVIDSFGKVSDPDSPDVWMRRWIPDVPSFGCFAASDAKAVEAASKGYLLLKVGFDKGKPFDGYIGEIENAEWLESATASFLENGNAALGAEFRTVTELVDALQKHLNSLLDRGHMLLAQLAEMTGAEPDLTLADAANRLTQPITLELETASAAIQQAVTDHRLVKSVASAWNEHQKTEPWWFSWLSFVPFVKKRKQEWVESFLLAQAWPPELGEPEKAESMARGLSAALTQVNARGRAAEKRERELAEEIARIREKVAVFEASAADPFYAANGTSPITANNATLLALSERLDITMRARAFCVAARYWEGRYLLDLHEKLAAGISYDSKAPVRLERALRRIAKLTPCMVSTLYSLPKFYRAFSDGAPSYLLNRIDLLIVDEAGQVAPETGFGPFLLAKKALIVGDTAQIEPVWSISSRIDAQNARASRVIPDGEEYDQWSSHRGSAAADGNLMRMAQLACRWRVSPKPALPDGLMLREHRRCDPVIIDYCNELLYEGELIPCRPPVEDRILPAMGYAHVQTPAQRQGQSWYNDGEARVIASWLEERREQLEQHYGKPLSEIVGVVTPFRPQRNRILRSLGANLGASHGITVGTVHALQGAERDIVIFSPTYGEGFEGTPFFDRAPNMLNVAASRARDSFLVFGNMALFNTLRRSPAGLLGRHLFREPTNEIVDVDPKVASRLPEGGSVLSGGASHHAHLQESLISAAQGTNIIIASPWVTRRALESTAPHLSEATSRGINVAVYFDWHMTSERAGGNIGDLIEMMRACGVTLHSNQRGKRQFHNKTLTIGDSEIIEGSYNWLSAIRDETHRYHRHERSLCLTGASAADAITGFREEMNALCSPL